MSTVTRPPLNSEGLEWTGVGKLETVRSAKDRLGWKRLALVSDLNPSRPLEPVLLEKRVLAELAELIDCLEDSRTIGEITKSHGQTLNDPLITARRVRSTGTSRGRGFAAVGETAAVNRLGSSG